MSFQNGVLFFLFHRFVDQYLQQFIQSANKHFMSGYNVIFYILMEDFSKLPPIELGPLRTLKLCIVLRQHVWKDLNYIYMRNLHIYILEHIQYEVDFLFSMAVNQIFKNDFGVEALGKSVAQLHAWWYFGRAQNFPYERSPNSAAFIPFGEGDFYYHGAIFGGTAYEVLAFLEEYKKGVQNDARSGFKSTYEHYLNKYLFINKPTKLLSPEYNWDPNFRPPPQIKHVKIEWRSKSI
ncbi:glycosyltransferase 6 domain-containing protein 1-like [Mirounga angustirostris]|uniref:glycosyltransferase 6 domain-containing protein 1-like n=1 Tax=Mirounga leonina TaxID=9715 RepID=UPI00156C0566|nr:glycosyltransferase 6 domain-containing protein 1-like [Mirounga leonina]XP_045737829.1 glycosyltransferase 6 domain-containing protein 1-like [Mirounga angustirostris]